MTDPVLWVLASNVLVAGGLGVIGTGGVGGKAAGLVAASRMLAKAFPEGRHDGIEVRIPPDRGELRVTDLVRVATRGDVDGVAHRPQASAEDALAPPRPRHDDHHQQNQAAQQQRGCSSGPGLICIPTLHCQAPSGEA